MVCDQSHPHFRLAIIAIFTIFLIVIFQAWYDVYKTVLYNLIGTNRPSDSQVFWSTLALTFAFLFFIKVGLSADIEPILITQALS